jgi:tRNA threonylcarbamoyladenosine biosynthesis protein TsaE
VEILSRNPQETVKLGRRLARYLRPGDIICLYGPLGSGKTTFVKGVAEGLGVPPKEVTSPSFVLIKEYKGKIPIFHIDLFRLDSNQEIEVAGLQDCLTQGGVILVEWAQKGQDIFDSLNCLWVEFDLAGKNKRKINLVPKGRHFDTLLRNLRLKGTRCVSSA